MLPIASLIGLAAPAWAARLAARVRPNPYAPSVPDQARVAGTQQLHAFRAAGELRGGLVARAGSQADYWRHADSMAGPALGQDLAGIPQPPCMFRAGDPGAGSEPTLQRDFHRGPVRLPRPWRASTRGIHLPGQYVVASTLLPPGAKTPQAAAVVAARTAAGRDDDAGMWGD